MSESSLKQVVRYSLFISLAIFVVFFVGVLLTGTFGMRHLLTDLQEMTLLFMTVIFFVAGILAKEALNKIPS
jgi:flagellar biosynthesis protein FliQ